MRPGNPSEFVECTVTCSCGNTFVTRSTNPEMRIDICSNCHPFFTGTQRLVDTQGQVDRFKRRLEKRLSLRKPSAVS